MYKITGIDVKSNRYKVLDTVSNIESICTRGQLLQSRDMGFKVLGVFPDGQIVVWNTFYKLSMLSDNSKEKLKTILHDYRVVVVTDDNVVSEWLKGNFIVLNISNRTSMRNMFVYCGAASLDLSDFDTSKVTNMIGMFRECKATSLDLRNFDTSKVTSMGGMFWGCKALSLDLSNFNTSNVTNMNNMFYSCKTSNLDLRSFDTSNVYNMAGMFDECLATSLDLSSFDTSNVTDMQEMFCGCRTVSLDLRNFDTSSVTNMDNMFYAYLGNEIILRKSQEKLINQVKLEGQESKIRYV